MHIITSVPHVYDFKIIVGYPKHCMKLIKSKFLVKYDGPPCYYLGNDEWWEYSEELCNIGCNTYYK